MSRSKRLDLSDWVCHFVHSAHSEEPSNVQPDGSFLPETFHENREIGERFDMFSIFEQERQMENSDPFYVLQRIVETGFIKSSWAWRKERATIYGPRTAVCFTEMPLHALLQYAKDRANNASVSPYCIALSRAAFYQAGGRPVIYGLSTDHKESGHHAWPRKLDTDCGITELEQYRYVAMNLGSRTIDWTHEREWRWQTLETNMNNLVCPFGSTT